MIGVAGEGQDPPLRTSRLFIILRKKAAARVSGGLVLLNLLNYSRVEKCLMVRTI